MNKLEVIDIRKTYYNKIVLDNVSFELTSGIYALLGPNGSGKSTLINILTGNIKATSGSIFWNGEKIGKLGRRYREILGYVPQKQALYPNFTVTEFLYYMAALREIPKEIATKRIDRVLQEVELTETTGYKIKTLSGGMKQRLLIAQSLLGNSQFLIMDEPTVGLDPKQRLQIRNLIQRNAQNRIILLATHIVTDIEHIADEILLIKNGKIIKKKNRKNLIDEMQQTGKTRTLEDVYFYYLGEKNE